MKKRELDFSVVPNYGTRDSKHKLKTRKFHLNMRKSFFFIVRVGQTLAQVAWRGCGVLIPGDIQNLTGYGPGQPAVAGPDLSRWDGLDDLQRFFLIALIW